MAGRGFNAYEKSPSPPFKGVGRVRLGGALCRRMNEREHD
jgi:hypothetical protein